MSCKSCGCCLGMVFGFVFAVAILVAAAFGIYCYFNPEARNSSIDAVETQWIKIKSGGDDLIEQSRGIGGETTGAKAASGASTESEVKAAPEPQVTPAGGANAPCAGRPLPLTDPTTR